VCAGLVGRHPFARQAVAGNVLHYIGRFDNPAQQFSLRAIDPERYQIINEADGGRVMEEIEESKAFFQVYDGAVYMFQVRSSPGSLLSP
jgi:DEAD/DEAH box helicase domain-containing protein